MHDLLQIEAVVSRPFMENTWIVGRASRDDCIVVDPGFQPENIVRRLRDQGKTPALILLTHGHVDHIAGNAELKREWPDLPIVIGTRDEPMLSNPRVNFSAVAGQSVTSPPADRLVAEGDSVAAAGLSFDVLDIPGHSPGHVVYVLRSEEPIVVFGGDVLFQGSIGRCDFPGGDQELLVRGIRQKLFSLPDDTRVFPGHGKPTTVVAERQNNPFCGTGS